MFSSDCDSSTTVQGVVSWIRRQHFSLLWLAHFSSFQCSYITSLYLSLLFQSSYGPSVFCISLSKYHFVTIISVSTPDELRSCGIYLMQLLIVIVSLFSCILLITLLQFNGSDELQLKLINTGSDTLVYAAEETPLGTQYTSHSFSDANWHENENWLGRALMSVRDKLVCI